VIRFMGAGAKMVRLPYFLAAFRVHDLSKTSMQSRTVGADEIDLLRIACHGRPLTELEILKQWYRGVAEENLLRWLWGKGIRW